MREWLNGLPGTVAGDLVVIALFFLAGFRVKAPTWYRRLFGFDESPPQP